MGAQQKHATGPADDDRGPDEAPTEDAGDDGSGGEHGDGGHGDDDWWPDLDKLLEEWRDGVGGEGIPVPDTLPLDEPEAPAIPVGPHPCTLR